MDNKINLKSNKESSQLVKSIGAMMFNVFASFFNWFVMVICLLILISGYWWLIKPKYDFIASDQELTFREKEYEDKVTYLKQLNEVKNIYKNINQSDKDKIDSMLSVRQDVDRLKIILLREVGQLAKETGAALDNVVISPLDNSTGKFLNIAESQSSNNPLYAKLKIVSVSFSLRTVDYTAVKNILTRLEKSLRVMDVTKLSLDPNGKSASVELMTYYLEQ